MWNMEEKILQEEECQNKKKERSYIQNVGQEEKESDGTGEKWCAPQREKCSKAVHGQKLQKVQQERGVNRET